MRAMGLEAKITKWEKDKLDMPREMPGDFQPAFVEEKRWIAYHGMHSCDKDGSTQQIDLGCPTGNGFGALPREKAEHYLRMAVWQAREMVRLGLPLQLSGTP